VVKLTAKAKAKPPPQFLAPASMLSPSTLKLSPSLLAVLTEHQR